MPRRRRPRVSNQEDVRNKEQNERTDCEDDTPNETKGKFPLNLLPHKKKQQPHPHPGRQVVLGHISSSSSSSSRWQVDSSNSGSNSTPDNGNNSNVTMPNYFFNMNPPSRMQYTSSQSNSSRSQVHPIFQSNEVRSSGGTSSMQNPPTSGSQTGNATASSWTTGTSATSSSKRMNNNLDPCILPQSIQDNRGGGNRNIYNENTHNMYYAPTPMVSLSSSHSPTGLAQAAPPIVSSIYSSSVNQDDTATQSSWFRPVSSGGNRHGERIRVAVSSYHGTAAYKESSVLPPPSNNSSSCSPPRRRPHSATSSCSEKSAGEERAPISSDKSPPNTTLLGKWMSGSSSKTHHPFGFAFGSESGPYILDSGGSREKKIWGGDNAQSITGSKKNKSSKNSVPLLPTTPTLTLNVTNSNNGNNSNPQSIVSSGSNPTSAASLFEEDKSSGTNSNLNNKSPLPQNLRGDPFRSAKVKTELCRHFGTSSGCPFGEKCNYAHGEQELKYTKLMDLERAGLIDVEIFRTHPCPTWVSTGACPFDQRCSGLHDPRIIGSSPSWLPHAETLVNSICSSSVNVDKLYHERLASVYSCSPIYGYVPRKRWNSNNSRRRRRNKHHDTAACDDHSAFQDFYEHVCNLNGSELNFFVEKEDNPPTSTIMSGQQEPPWQAANDCSKSVSDIHQILIALKMREQKLGQCYSYLPTHLLFGELCMVLQSRYFQKHPLHRYALIELDNATHHDKPSQENNNKDEPPSTTIEAHEIIFGPVGDPGVKPVSIWFNIGGISNNLIQCTPQQAKRHKRSRHRLKKIRSDSVGGATNKLVSPRASTPSPSPSTVTVAASNNTTTAAAPDVPINNSTANDSSIAYDSIIPPFYNYQPMDDASFELVTNILRHRAQALLLLELNQTQHNAAAADLLTAKTFLQAGFESQRRHWMTFDSWPVNLERLTVDDDTDVPMVDGMYVCQKKAGRENLSMDAFWGAREDDAGDTNMEVDTRLSDRITELLWMSFLENISLEGERGPYRDKRRSDRRGGSRSDRDAVGRLPVFVPLSGGLTMRSEHRSRTHLPNIHQEAFTRPKKEQNVDIGSNGTDLPLVTTIQTLFQEWDIVKEHFKSHHPNATNNSPVRNNNSSTINAAASLPSQAVDILGGG